MNDLYVSLALKPGETQFTLRASESEYYKELFETTLDLGQTKAVLGPIDWTVGTNLVSLAERAVNHNRSEKVKRIQSLEQTLAKLRSELD